MMNPYGVQRLCDLGLEEMERQHGRQAGRAHEVGAERRRKDAANAELSLTLAEAAGERAAGGTRVVPRPALARRLVLRLARLEAGETAA